jgi:hypothetical protein
VRTTVARAHVTAGARASEATNFRHNNFSIRVTAGPAPNRPPPGEGPARSNMEVEGDRSCLGRGRGWRMSGHQRFRQAPSPTIGSRSASPRQLPNSSTINRREKRLLKLCQMITS